MRLVDFKTVEGDQGRGGASKNFGEEQNAVHPHCSGKLYTFAEEQTGEKVGDKGHDWRESISHAHNM